MNRLLSDRDDAMRAGDPDALAFTEHRIDRLFEEVRAARTEQPRDRQTGEFASFDGGVRGRRPPPTPNVHQETAAALFQRALVASRQERAEREADPGHTIITNNF